MCFRFLRTLLCDHYRELGRTCRCRQIVDIEQLRYCCDCQNVADELDPKEAAEYRKKRVHEIALEIGWEEVRRLYFEQVDRDKKAGIHRLPYEENVFPFKGDLKLLEDEKTNLRRDKEKQKHEKDKMKEYRREKSRRNQGLHIRIAEDDTMTDIIWEKRHRKLTTEEKEELRKKDMLKKAAVQEQRRKDMETLERIQKELAAKKTSSSRWWHEAP